MEEEEEGDFTSSSKGKRKKKGEKREYSGKMVDELGWEGRREADP